jgi:hypothetical protein
MSLTAIEQIRLDRQAVLDVLVKRFGSLSVADVVQALDHQENPPGIFEVRAAVDWLVRQRQVVEDQDGRRYHARAHFPRRVGARSTSTVRGHRIGTPERQCAWTEQQSDGEYQCPLSVSAVNAKFCRLHAALSRKKVGRAASARFRAKQAVNV